MAKNPQKTINFWNALAAFRPYVDFYRHILPNMFVYVSNHPEMYPLIKDNFSMKIRVGAHWKNTCQLNFVPGSVKFCMRASVTST